MEFPKRLVIGALVLVLCMQPAALATKAPSGMRNMKLSVFYHDTNKTDVLVARNLGPGGNSSVTQVSAAFGSIFVFGDPITATEDASSPVLGSVAGIFSSVSSDGLTFYFTFTVALNTTAPPPGTPDNLRGLDGSINIIGLFNALTPTHPFSVAGGAGTFAFAQGSVTILPIDVRTFVQLFRLDLDLYLPY